MKIIFVVDDSAVNLATAKQALERDYQVFTLPSAKKMFDVLEKVTPDLILLDILMPDEDGFSAIRKLKGIERTAEIPVVFLTASLDEETEVRGLELGAADFIKKPYSEAVLRNRVVHHLQVYEQIRKQMLRLENMQDGILSVIADMIENRDKVTGWHVERTTEYVRILINTMVERNVYADEIRNWDLEKVISSARLHDVGKIFISDLILNKPDKLDAEEYELIKTHAAKGEQIIEQMMTRTGEEAFLRHAKLFAGFHHERWDGKGYPNRLNGAEIPLQGRIMAVADVYDALISERPYKKPFKIEEVIKIITEEAGKQFDPRIVDVFLEVKDRFQEVFVRSGK
ncbi:MAG: response regulator [Fibromonadaceae bacterium]|jgi:putative two-component system response regulator|nr:response regulator [Fibromonadaceae bacterium]